MTLRRKKWLPVLLVAIMLAGALGVAAQEPSTTGWSAAPLFGADGRDDEQFN